MADRTKQPTKQKSSGHVLTGILGACLGALMCMLLTYLVGLVYVAGAVLFLLFSPVFIMAGYRLCRGWKNKVFAYGMTGLTAVVTAILLPFIIDASYYGSEQLLWNMSSRDLQRNLEISLLCGVISLISFWRFERILRGYLIAPHQRARYEAGKYAGGMMYNMCPQQIPMREIPKRFYVGGKLEVEGEQLRTIPSLAKSKTFSVDEVAGVVLGGCTGSNVLYDSEYQVLAKFAWSMANSEVLFWYLQRHQVPFYNLPAHLQCNHIEPKQ